MLIFLSWFTIIRLLPEWISCRRRFPGCPILITSNMLKSARGMQNAQESSSAYVGIALRYSRVTGCIPPEAFVHGATGWVCGSANVLPRETAEIFELAVEKGNLIAARDYAQKMMSFFFRVETEGAFVQYLKAAMELIGRPMGHPRRPLLPVSKETKHRIKVALEKATARSLLSV